MMTEPKGVMQNHAAPQFPPDLRPVSRENWKMFASLADAEKALEMIRKVVPDAEMKNATQGGFGQFVYDSPDPDIRVRLVEGIAPDCGGRRLAISEFASDILDRSIEPLFFIDRYRPGQTPVLRCSSISDEIGQLYWDAK